MKSSVQLSLGICMISRLIVHMLLPLLVGARNVLNALFFSGAVANVRKTLQTNLTPCAFATLQTVESAAHSCII